MKITEQTLIKYALEEDLGSPPQDVTSLAMFADLAPRSGRVALISKHPTPVTLCGVKLVADVFKQLQADVNIIFYQHDGDVIEPHQSILSIEGDRTALAMGERTALNFIRHLSAVATLTAQFVDLVQETGLKILDTRKTIPLLRSLEKYAVKCGGGVNHRMGLFDAILVKDTHIDLLGGMAAAISRLPTQKNVPIIVEVRTLAELEIILRSGCDIIDRILFDNMSCAEMKQGVNRLNGQIPTEASGNIGLNNIQQIAATGVDFASIGALTCAGSVDLSMRKEKD